MKKIGLFTSGGDSPGMNAAIRSVVRSALLSGVEVYGFYYGYNGIIAGDCFSMDRSSVGNIIQRGGTILKSARSKEFLTKEGREKAAESLKNLGIEGLIGIGGDGTFKGALEFHSEYNIPFVGIPGTIDNDLYGTDYTLGFDTAINTVVEAVDRIRDTADSHHRLFLIEVMGRDAGGIALHTGLATGAEAILIPETPTDFERIVKTLENGYQQKKSSSIVIVAEGDEAGGAFKTAERLQQTFDHFEIRVTILGHLQRGGPPSCMDRVRGTLMGNKAVECLINGEHNVMVGIINQQLCTIPLEKAVKQHAKLDITYVDLAERLS